MENVLMGKGNDEKNDPLRQNIKVWKCESCSSTWCKAVPVIAIGPADDSDDENAKIVPKMQAIQIECAGCGKPVMIQSAQKIPQKSNIVSPNIQAQNNSRQRFNFPGAS